jgi:hypothetical protein
MATIDTTNVPAGMYPTQQNFTVAAPMSGMYPVQQGVAYAQPQAVVVPNAQASSGGEAPYPQVIAQGNGFIMSLIIINNDLGHNFCQLIYNLS